MSAARPPGEERQRAPDQTATATLLPPTTVVDAYTGEEVQTIFYSLPMPADDGPDTLVLLPANFKPFSTIPEYTIVRLWYETAGLEAPPATRDGRAWVPLAPTYVPLHAATRMPSFYDAKTMIIWPLITGRASGIRRHLPLYEGRSPHFFLGPPMTPFPASAEIQAEMDRYYPGGTGRVRTYQQAIARAIDTGTLPALRGGHDQQAALASAASARGNSSAPRAAMTTSLAAAGAGAEATEPQHAAEQRASASSSSAAAAPTSATSLSRNATSSSAQSNASPTTSSSRIGARPAGIQRGFLNRTSRTRPADAQAARQPGENRKETLGSAMPITEPSEPVAAEESNASSPNNDARSGRERPTSTTSSPLASAAQSMGGSGRNGQAASPSASTTTPLAAATSVSAQQTLPQQHGGPQAPSRPQQQGNSDEEYQTSWGHTARATLLAHDEETRLAMSRGVPVSAYYYSLPFEGPDGRQTLIMVPSDFLPSGRSEMPQSPLYFTPAPGSGVPIPMLHDDDTSTNWPLINISRDGGPVLPFPGGAFDGRNPRKAHFLAGPKLPGTVSFSFPEGMSDPRRPQQGASSAGSQHACSAQGARGPEAAGVHTLRAATGQLGTGGEGEPNSQDSLSRRETPPSTSAASTEQPQRRQESRGDPSPSSGEQPRWTRPDLPRATLLPTQVDPRTGEVLRASFYSLPLTASDGQQMLAVMPSDYYPFTSPEQYMEASSYYRGAGLQPPPYYNGRVDGEAWVPGSPHYVASREGSDRPATLYDNDSLISWPLIDVASRPDLLANLPSHEGRQAHFVLGRPTVPFSTSGEQPRTSGSQHRGGHDFGSSRDPVMATLLSAEEVNRGGGQVSSFYYKLPFAAADGRQALLIMPVESVPFPTPEAHATARPHYVDAGYRPPPYTRDGGPYVPLAPIFMPPQEDEGLQVPILYDSAASYMWRVVEVGGTDPLATLPWWDGYDPLQAHFIVAQPITSIPSFADSETTADVPQGLPVTQQYERTASWPPPASPYPTSAPNTSTTAASTSSQRASGSLNRSQRRQRERQAQQQGVQQQRGQQSAQQRPSAGQQRQPVPSLNTQCRATIEAEDPNYNRAEVCWGVDTATAYYTLPFLASDGRQTLIAMPGESLPMHEAVPVDRGRQAFFVPTAATYIPAEMSPDNIPVLRAEIIHLSWPLISMADPNAPTLNPWQRMRRPHFITGRYVRDGESPRQGLHGDGNEMDLTTRIKRFVDELDTADAEVMLRMARLGIGEIGDEAAGEKGIGCAVCIEMFHADDEPESVSGAKSHDQQVVIAPCDGFHLFHKGCLRQALEAVKSWRKWACPMCRSPLRDAAAKRVEELEGRSGAGVATTSSAGNGAGQTTIQKSLREEIHRREKERGYLYEESLMAAESKAPEVGSSGSGEGSSSPSSSRKHEGVVVADKGKGKAQAKKKGKKKGKGKGKA